MIKNGDQLSGISLNIWRRVAEDNNLTFQLIGQPSSKAGIEAVDDGEIDVLVISVLMVVGSLIAVSFLTAICLGIRPVGRDLRLCDQTGQPTAQAH